MYSIIFSSQVLASIGLIEYHHCSWLQFLSLHSSSCCHSKSQGQIIEVKNADGGILRNIFGHSGDVGVDDVVSIEVGHLSVTFDPNLMLAIFGQVVQTGDIQPEFSALREFPYQQPRGEHFFFGYVGGHVGDESIDVVYPIFDEPEN